MVHSLDTPASGREASQAGYDPAHVWVIIPAYNEGHVVVEVVQTVLSYNYSVVVVDDGSSMPLLPFLEHTRAHVIRHAVNLGQGAALQTGIEYALRHAAEYIVTFDADGQHQAVEIERIVRPLAEGRSDVTLGTRFASGGEALNIPRLKRLILKAAVLFTRVTSGLKVTDTHNGFRGFTAAAASQINITQNRMAHASQILSQIRTRNLRYLEVPVTIRYTDYSIKKGQRIFNLINILIDLLKGVLDS